MKYCHPCRVEMKAEKSFTIAGLFDAFPAFFHSDVALK